MTILDQLQTLTYNNIPILFISSNTTGGRKTITHEYPNRDFRFTEDLGKLQKRFSLQVTINSNNYINDKDRLITELEKTGPGQLIHPTFGVINVQVITWSLNETITDLGRPTFNIEFEQTSISILPDQSKDNTTQITNNTQALLNQTQVVTENNYINPQNIFQNFQDAKNKIDNFLVDVQEISRNFSQVTNNISSFANTISNIQDTINTVVTSPFQVALSINNVFVEVQTLFTNPLEDFLFNQGLFNFGNDDIPVENLSQNREDLIDNRILLNNNIQLNALALAYESIINIEFGNIQELTEIRNALEAQFQVLNAKDDIDFDTKEILFELRNEAEIFIEEQEKILPNIEIVRVYNLPLSVLVYQYYGNLDNTQEILDINPNVENVLFFDGEVNILKN